MSEADVAKILALPVDERLQLIALICESLEHNDVEVPLSDAQRALIDERLAEHELFPDDVISLEEVLAFARTRHRHSSM